MKLIFIILTLTFAGCATPFNITSDGKTISFVVQPVKFPLPTK